MRISFSKNVLMFQENRLDGPKVIGRASFLAPNTPTYKKRWIINGEDHRTDGYAYIYKNHKGMRLGWFHQHKFVHVSTLVKEGTMEGVDFRDMSEQDILVMQMHLGD